MPQHRSRRSNGAPEIPVRSVRVTDPSWDRATRRARLEGTNMSAVVQLFVEGYGRGLINAPQTRVVYEATPQLEVPTPAQVGEA